MSSREETAVKDKQDYCVQTSNFVGEAIMLLLCKHTTMLVQDESQRCSNLKLYAN